MREAKPHEYLKVVASLLPREINCKDTTLDGLTDEQIRDGLAKLRRLIADNHERSSRNIKGPRGTCPTLTQKRPHEFLKIRTKSGAINALTFNRAHRSTFTSGWRNSARRSARCAP